jgi:hypothetical protein
MALWKARTGTGVRVYFKAVSAGSLVTGLGPGAFTVKVINPTDTAVQAVTVAESSQQGGVYYFDVPSAFLMAHDIGHYGLSVGIHSAVPSLDDEALFPLEVNATDIDFISDVSTGAALNRLMDTFVLTTGNEDAGSVSSTFGLDGGYHQFSDDAGEFDGYYETTLDPGRFPVYFSGTGRVNGNNDSMIISAKRWADSSWVQVGFITGKNQSTDDFFTGALFQSMVGTGVNEGKVQLRFHQTGLSSASLYIDQLFIGFTSNTAATGEPMSLTSGERLEVADAILSRNVSSVETSSALQSLASAILKLTSRFDSLTGRTYRTDGATVHMTQTPVFDDQAEPITELGKGT